MISGFASGLFASYQIVLQLPYEAWHHLDPGGNDIVDDGIAECRGRLQIWRAREAVSDGRPGRLILFVICDIVAISLGHARLRGRILLSRLVCIGIVFFRGCCIRLLAAGQHARCPGRPCRGRIELDWA
jgi:hypothetical protein